MLQVMADMCHYAALFRSNYTYQGLYYLVKMFTEAGQYLNQQQLADIMNHDRTSISKALSRMRKEYPDVWEAYAANKRRELSRPVPGEA